jgi:hypothetical protein
MKRLLIDMEPDAEKDRVVWRTVLWSIQVQRRAAVKRDSLIQH